MKRIIITVSDDEHAKVKAYSASVKSDMQRVGIAALNKYFEDVNADIHIANTEAFKKHINS